MIKLKYSFNNCTKKLLFNHIMNYIFIGKYQCNVHNFERHKYMLNRKKKKIFLMKFFFFFEISMQN